MAEINGIPVEVFELFDKSMWAILVPVTLTTMAQMYQNSYDPVALEQINKIRSRPSYALRLYDSFFGTGYNDGKVGEDITIGDITITVFYLSYVITYFVSLYSFLGGLMGYNLLAVFGLDVKIGNFVRSLTQWFTTPPTEEQLEEIEAADTFD